MSKKVLLFCACMAFAGYANASSEVDKERSFGYVVLTEGFLKQQISRIGIIAQDGKDAGTVKRLVIPHSVSIRIQSFHNRGNTATGNVEIKNVLDSRRLFRNNCQRSVDISVAEHGAVPGNRIGDIGHAVQSYCEERGYGVVRDFVGHGVGKLIVQRPSHVKIL